LDALLWKSPVSTQFIYVRDTVFNKESPMSFSKQRGTLWSSWLWQSYKLEGRGLDWFSMWTNDHVAQNTYKDKNLKKDSWQSVGSEFGMTAEEAYKKFRSLRKYAKNEHQKLH
jgi:hypothetical protein